MLGVHPRWVLPAGPNNKAPVEHLFRTFDEDFSKARPGDCPNAPANRPEAHRHLIEQAVDFDEFAARLRR